MGAVVQGRIASQTSGPISDRIGPLFRSEVLHCSRTHRMNLNCPMPIARYDTITLAHGGGGTLTAALIHEIFRPAFGATTSAPHDATAFQLANSRIAVTTDSYVVQPLFFPGGDIGSLAVNGSVNDLLMAGARPRILTAGFILEEGLSLATLQQVAESMRRAAETAGVRIIAGDTKVIERSRGDGLYINTSGVGEIIADDGEPGGCGQLGQLG